MYPDDSGFPATVTNSSSPCDEFGTMCSYDSRVPDAYP